MYACSRRKRGVLSLQAQEQPVRVLTLGGILVYRRKVGVLRERECVW
jgi:hypothetical protein